jgi:hypothetical protein
MRRMDCFVAALLAIRSYEILFRKNCAGRNSAQVFLTVLKFERSVLIVSQNSENNKKNKKREEISMTSHAFAEVVSARRSAIQAALDAQRREKEDGRYADAYAKEVQRRTRIVIHAHADALGEGLEAMGLVCRQHGLDEKSQDIYNVHVDKKDHEASVFFEWGRDSFQAKIRSEGALFYLHVWGKWPHEPKDTPPRWRETSLRGATTLMSGDKLLQAIASEILDVLGEGALEKFDFPDLKPKQALPKYATPTPFPFSGAPFGCCPQ